MKTAVVLLLVMVALCCSAKRTPKRKAINCDGKPILLTVVAAKERFGDGKGKPDVYVQVYNNGKYIRKTKVRSSYLPLWDSHYFIPKVHNLKLKVWDSDQKTADDFIGECSIKHLRPTQRLFKCGLGRKRGYIYYKYLCLR